VLRRVPRLPRLPGDPGDEPHRRRRQDDRGRQPAGVSLDEFTAPYIDSFFADLDALHVERAERYPRATEHVPEMIALIERLLAAGVAYEKDGSVFFRIAADDDYGKLSGIDVEEVRQGERVASDEYGKEDVRDFVLWKAARSRASRPGTAPGARAARGGTSSARR
jgi:cysteinyl-tRNA synthetase